MGCMSYTPLPSKNLLLRSDVSELRKKKINTKGTTPIEIEEVI